MLFEKHKSTFAKEYIAFSNETACAIKACYNSKLIKILLHRKDTNMTILSLLFLIKFLSSRKSCDGKRISL